jgi:hypothetical protein
MESTSSSDHGRSVHITMRQPTSSQSERLACPRRPQLDPFTGQEAVEHKFLTSGVRGVTRSTPARANLPSFATLNVDNPVSETGVIRDL